ncbi:hypothetical protein FIE12Z_3821 [Fusarium flagelliforme]|uniref:Xylanolytic transcriptional activator regulatory domain-containing protein n=1 Tax=Fusarium flagelliforme TaxID=2675880 RepID=A0A395MVU1_9HYPO|nr:hypothetical protein FIE12Z_3821 [Fusarium flagelliforme]
MESAPYITHKLQAAAIKRKNNLLEERMVDHENLYDSLKTRQPDEAQEILRRIRAGNNIKSVTENFQEGGLLLQLTSPTASHAPLSTSPGATPSNTDTIGNRVIDRTMFEEDLKALNPNAPNQPNKLRFCSPFLINALLAVSCAAFLQSNDPSTRGQAFAREAARLLPLEDTDTSLTVAQGLTLMNAYEAALGNGETALSYHSRMQARYLALRLNDMQRSTNAAIARARQRREAYTLSLISWGFYVWDWKLIHGLYRRLIIKKPNRPKTWYNKAASPLCKRDNPNYWWFPYPVSVVPQKSWKREIFAAECDLAELTEQVLKFLIPLEDSVAPRRNIKRAIELYTKIVNLTAELIIVSMLRPFKGLSKDKFGPFDPVTTSYAHASNTISAIWHFRALYTLRNQPWIIQASSVCAFRVLSDIDSSPIQLKTFVKACQALVELGESFPVAKDVILSLESVVKKQRLRIPSCAQEQLSNQMEDKDNGIDSTVVKIMDHNVVIQKANSEDHTGHLTLTGSLSSMAPIDIGPD